MAVIYTGGTFDALHVGHLELLEACRALAGPHGRVVVALNTDAFVESYKGRRSLVPFAQRRELLLQCRLVDAVVANVGGADSRLSIEVVAPDLLAVGDDWLDPGHDERRYLAQLGVTNDWLAERSLRVEYVARTRGVSSSARRDRFEHPRLGVHDIRGGTTP